MTIEQARERVNAATPGPWKPGPFAVVSEADLVFIASARTEYPLALDVIEAAKALCDPECPETPPYWNALHAAIAAFEAATE